MCGTDLWYAFVVQICSTNVWYTFVVQIYGTHLWYRSVVHICGTHLWYTFVVQMCGTHLWYRFVVRICGTNVCTFVVQICGTDLWYIFVVHICGSDVWYTFVVQICAHLQMPQLYMSSTSLYLLRPLPATLPASFCHFLPLPATSCQCTAALFHCALFNCRKEGRQILQVKSNMILRLLRYSLLTP